jgi:hypothetical protein
LIYAITSHYAISFRHYAIIALLRHFAFHAISHAMPLRHYYFLIDMPLSITAADAADIIDIIIDS